MTCPDCGHQNMDGVDSCDHCGQDLRSIDIPAGKEGHQHRVMETPLRDLAPALALTVAPGEPVGNVIRLMQTQKHGSALVVEDGRIVGIFTESDALMRLAGRTLNLGTLPVRDVMTREPKILTENDSLAFALHWMAVGNCRHIPVVRKGQAPRFVSVRGVLRYLHEHAR